MIGIMALLANISQAVTATELRQLRVIVPAVLAMTGQVTMLNIMPGGTQPCGNLFPLKTTGPATMHQHINRHHVSLSSVIKPGLFHRFLPLVAF